jgi:hypothetical protein
MNKLEIDTYLLPQIKLNVSKSFLNLNETIIPVPLIIYGFTSRSRICHWYGDVTIAGEGLQNLGLCSAHKTFEQGGIFIVQHLLCEGASVFLVSFSRLFRHARGCGGSILTWILTGVIPVRLLYQFNKYS